MFVFKAAVVGAGTMGGEIAQAIADAEIPVVLKDIEQRFVDHGLERARSIWQVRVDAGKLDPAELERRANLIYGATDFSGFGDVDFVIEAVPRTWSSSRRSSPSSTRSRRGTRSSRPTPRRCRSPRSPRRRRRADKVVGFHFFFPASVMRAIEVVEGEYTSPETMQVASTFAQAIRKMPVRCGEAPGFIVNRILNAGVSEIGVSSTRLGFPSRRSIV